MKKTTYIVAFLLSVSLLSAQKKKDTGSNKNPNPVETVTYGNEKDVNDYIVKKFGYPERVEYFELQDALKHPDEVTSLKLRNLELTEVPKEISAFKNLVELDLSDNKITSVSGKLSGLSNLQVLNLSGNELTDIPSDLSSLKNLRVLNLSTNKISGGSLSNDKLERLYLNNNELTSIPSGVMSMKELKTLYLHQNSLTSLDEGLLKLNHLEALMVQLNKIPVEPDAFNHHNGIIAYAFYPQAVSKNHLYKAMGGGGIASAGSFSGGYAGGGDDDEASSVSAFTFGGEKVEDYDYNIRSNDIGNGFRKIKVKEVDYRRYSKLRLYFLMPYGCLLLTTPIHWVISKSHRNNVRMSNIYYMQEDADKIIAKGPSNSRVARVARINKRIVKTYRRYLRDNKLTAN